MGKVGYVFVLVAVVWVVLVGIGYGAWIRVWRGEMVLCQCEM